MKKQDKKTAAAKPKTGKVSSALTGPGLLMPSDLDEVSGGSSGSTGRACAVKPTQTTYRCGG